MKRTTEDANSEPEEMPPPPFNKDLDPDNAVCPLSLEERVEMGRKLFYPEGGPEDPPCDPSLAQSA